LNKLSKVLEKLDKAAKPKAQKKIVDSSVFFKLIRLVNLTARPFNEVIGKHYELSLNEWRVMVVLASHPGCFATDVVDFTGLDKMSVSRALGALTKAKRIDRVADAFDARRAHVTLTRAGVEVFERISESAAQREAVMFASLSEVEITRLEVALDKLTAALARND
jgi:DNA-binding MarR family transcriptional regulator